MSDEAGEFVEFVHVEGDDGDLYELPDEEVDVEVDLYEFEDGSALVVGENGVYEF